MNLVVYVCFALAGSQFQDHCREELITLHNITPQACFMKAQEVIAEKAPLWEGERIDGYRCFPRNRH
ncbi:hypothetical protein [Methylobacterium sp. WL120]|uniref:hypothetical protein n=1 Tax=Methylobacterium sp. WL120 TaxID=2603887 RepID=UPI0011C7B80C|nr:hypothetical protein [Methylobacterium sp. WL120]TXM69608.1 hypothetical protein FV229_04500 [Methylobacterium sp. WL120]